MRLGAPPGRLDVEAIDVSAILGRREHPVQLLDLLVICSILGDTLVDLLEFFEDEPELEEVNGLAMLSSVCLEDSCHEAMWEEEA